MSISAQQAAERLLKKSMGVAESAYPLTTRSVLEEATGSYSAVSVSDIWLESSKIPTVSPTLLNTQISGVIQYYDKLQLLINDAGTSVAFRSPNGELQNSISTKFGFSYKFRVWSNDGNTEIFKGDYYLDYEAGILEFYNINLTESPVSALLPPKISFYKYVGERGLSISGSTSGLNVKLPVRLATNSGDTLINYNYSTSGFTSLPTTIDGVTSFNEADRILVKNQVDKVQNGIYQVSGTTLVRALDSDGTPASEVAINNYVFVYSGVTENTDFYSNIGSSWVLTNTNAVDNKKIVVGVETEEWTLFSESKTYVTDGQGLNLDNSLLYLNLDETTNVPRGSGLTKAPSGLRITTALSNEISGNTTDIINLSGETINLQQQITDLSGVTNNIAGSGLSFLENKLNVNVDSTTIKIINNELRSTVQYSQFVTGVTIISGTTGSTTLSLTYKPVGNISAYINGVNYMISNLSGSSSVYKPFYFNNLPNNIQVGDILYYDATIGGFDINPITDLIEIKYNYINII